MIFESVRIKNLFSYQDGHFLFPLDADRDRNVVLIHGRNGFGKTSFINAMKLVFLGADTELTHNVRPGYKMGVAEYFLGSGPEWEGAFNRHARRDGETSCGVTLRWQEESGFVTITRTWTLDKKRGVTEALTVEPEFPIDEDELQNSEQKEAFIARRLPKALLPFFIYDAEQVQKLAEANMAGTIEQIERLLDITTTRLAEDALSRVLKKIRSTGNARQEQIKLDNLRNKLEAARIQGQQLDAEIAEKDREIAEMEYLIQQLDRSVEQDRELSHRNELEHRRAADNLKTHKATLESESFAFLDEFPVVAPFVAHPQLLQAALAQVEELLHVSRSGLAQELKDILERLPTRLFDEPQFPRPALEDGQTRFLKTKLINLLQAEMSLAASTQAPDAWQIDTERARRLIQSLRSLLGLNEKEPIKRLKEIGRLKSDIRQAQATLSDVSSLPEDERRRIEERMAEKARREGEAKALLEQRGGLKERIPAISREIEELRTDVSAQERSVVVASRNQFGVDITENLIQATRRYRDLLREQRRDDIQRTVNQRFKQLMESHGLIQEIRFAPDFRFSYHDAEGRPVGMANISAGMKQLAAQALLWGLKDLAHQDCPVVIDTPLARIDAQHQRHLITDYYPAAGQQVIVLPTDSELDREKYALLKPYVAREIQLSNPSGESTQVDIDTPMFV